MQIAGGITVSDDIRRHSLQASDMFRTVTGRRIRWFVNVNPRVR